MKATDQERETLKFCREPKDLFERYIRARKSNDIEVRQHDAAVEVRTRFEQLDYLLRRVADLEELKFPWTGTDQDIPMMVRLYTECFYYTSARLLAVLRKSPVIALEIDCRPITDIRNLLIEHPEGPDGQPIISWSWDHEDGRGPVLEGRYADGLLRVVVDQGLRRNAETLYRTLVTRFREGLNQLPQSETS